MNPAQAVLANIELPGIVTDDYAVAQKAVGLDAAPQRAFGGDLVRAFEGDSADIGHGAEEGLQLEGQVSGVANH
jgi:hypothetical protein